MKKIISKIKTMIKGEEIMKRFVGFCGFTGLLLAQLVLGMGLVASANDYPKNAVKIPNTYILPNGKFQPVTDFIGYPATPNPIEAAEIPQNPSMGDNPWTCMHNDSYMSDTYPVLEKGMPFGPLGHSPEVFSTWLGTFTDPVAIAVTIVFDKNGLLVTAPVKMIRAEAKAWVNLHSSILKIIDARPYYPFLGRPLVVPAFVQPVAISSLIRKTVSSSEPKIVPSGWCPTPKIRGNGLSPTKTRTHGT